MRLPLLLMAALLTVVGMKGGALFLVIIVLADVTSDVDILRKKYRNGR